MLQNIPKEKILEVVKQGPTIPNKITKVVGGDTMLIGAILSTLINSGEVKVSTLKIGGSPIYYVPTQEARLEEFIQYLNEKDRRTFNLLKEKQVLRDADQDPLTRVSLRAIRDFAKSFEIERSGTKEIFWRFYTIAFPEAQQLAIAVIHASTPVIEGMPKPVAAVQATPRESPNTLARDAVSEAISAPTRIMTESNVDPATLVDTESDAEPEEEHAAKEIKPARQDFFETIKAHIHKLGLDIISKEKIKKTEYTIVAKNHDNNEYIYCVAKDKKAINEGDLSTALIYAQNKKMPCMFIATGHLTKKAEAMMHKEFRELRLEHIHQ